MTIKEAIIKALEDLGEPKAYMDVYNHIKRSGYYSFDKGKTPWATVSAQLGDFIRHNDSRVGRTIIKNSPKSYGYYLKTADNAEKPIAIKDTPKTKEKYVERDLHPLLATFLNHENIYAKTIYHEESNKTDRNQKWIHPDMIGIKFIEYSNSVCQSFFMSTNKSDMVEIYSYELKREIHSDYELKQDFFQTVSNSSWANYGYLVAFDIESSLIDELKRLNNSFGIGFILLKANPFETQIVLPAKRRDLDFITIQKLCEINSKFKDISINQVK